MLRNSGGVAALALFAFTLVWTHSIEKVDWQEDSRVTPAGLELVQARVKGSGAGMEPPPEARLVDGWFRCAAARADAGGRARKFRCGRRMAAMPRWRCRTLSEIVGHPIGVNVTTMKVCDDQQKQRENARSIGSRAGLRWWWAPSIGPGWGNGKATAVTFAREGAQVFCVDRRARRRRDREDHRG